MQIYIYVCIKTGIAVCFICIQKQQATMLHQIVYKLWRSKYKQKEVMNMECPHLEAGKKESVCNASLTMMAPSVFETSIYCTTEEHYRCPILLAYTLRDGYRELMKAS